MAETTAASAAKAAKAAIDSKALDWSAAVREQLVATVKQSQQLTLDAVSTWVEVIGKVVPEMPSMPFAPEVPEVKETLAASFDVAEELLAAQRKFATGLIAALVPAFS